MAPGYLAQMFNVSINQTYQLGHNHQKHYLPKTYDNFLNEASPIEELFHGIKF